MFTKFIKYTTRLSRDFYREVWCRSYRCWWYYRLWRGKIYKSRVYINN